MVSTQLLGIRDQRVLEVMSSVPRHMFVDPAFCEQAYSDYPLPIGQGQTISQPYMVALMTESLKLHGGEKILEIGTGSGYQTAILAEFSSRVFSVEREPGLAKRARRILSELGYENIAIKVGDGSKGWSEFSPYDRILVTASAPNLPHSLIEQLSDNGFLVIPVGERDHQVLKILEKREGKPIVDDICSCTFVPLIGEEGWEGDS
jgi:protein-L-isoaspartate(D-aspartate) O-methyltransferase